MRTLIKTILPLCLLLTFAGAAAAQTPDGNPPSQETVCDGQTGAAYGLCTAFCEAMDCDSDDPQASQTACDKVGGKFLTITGQAPPCVVPAVVCPCVDGVPGFLAAVNSTIVDCTLNFFSPGFVVLRTSEGLLPTSEEVTGEGVCGFHDGTLLPITGEQALVCNDLLFARAAAAGVTCHF